jgi:REP element-mobilizing transposase RayT
MTTGYKISEQNKMYFLTLQVVEWIDIFSKQVYRDVVIDSIKFCQKHKGLEVYGYVIMSNHIHLILKSPKGELSNTLRDFKKYTSVKIIKEIKENEDSRKEWMLERMAQNAASHSRNTNYQLWTHENHAMILLSYSFAMKKLNYIHNNPVKAGIVEKPEHYCYSSAIDYMGGKGPVDIAILTKEL